LTGGIDRAHQADSNIIGAFNDSIARAPECIERWLQRSVASACELLKALVYCFPRCQTEAQDDSTDEIGTSSPAYVPDRRERRAVEFQVSTVFRLRCWRGKARLRDFQEGVEMTHLPGDRNPGNAVSR